jgi:hypothetical protein
MASKNPRMSMSSTQFTFCRSRAHRLTPADPVLVGLNTLQQWLWQRLQIPIAATHACPSLESY